MATCVKVEPCRDAQIGPFCGRRIFRSLWERRSVANPGGDVQRRQLSPPCLLYTSPSPRD